MRIFELSEEELICQDNFVNFCNENDICFIKTDYFYLGSLFSWKGKKHPSRIDKISLIGYSDYPITDKISNGFDIVFCINKSTKNTNTFGIPLGIMSDCTHNPDNKICGYHKSLIDVSNEQIEKNNLVYLNFDVNTNLNARLYVHDKFSTLPWVVVGNTIHNLNGYVSYLKDIKSSKFVLCPRGNGIDTHRIWESLYMGTIPTVIYEDTHELFTDLPILFINNWDEISYDFLNQKYEEITNKVWSYDKLKMSYWKNFIKEKISNI